MKFEYSDHYLVPCAVEKVERNHGNKRVSQVRTPLAANVANQRGICYNTPHTLYSSSSCEILFNNTGSWWFCL